MQSTTNSSVRSTSENSLIKNSFKKCAVKIYSKFDARNATSDGAGAPIEIVFTDDNCWAETHTRASWMLDSGQKYLLRGGAPR
jgi:hypothetical protein